MLITKWTSQASTLITHVDDASWLADEYSLVWSLK